jgi:hypothetical protein
VNPQPKLTAAPRAKLDGADEMVAFAATGPGPRAKSVVVHQYQPLLGPFRARYLLYGVVAALAAMALQFVAIDRPARDEQAARVVSQAAPPSASAPINPQLFEKSPPPPVEGPAESIGQPRLDELLARARQQIEALALTSPPGDNALETLQGVLAAIPSQPDALQGIQDIASKYAILAAQADKRGERNLAKRYLDKGLRLVPDHPDLLAIEKRLALAPSAPIRADQLRMAPTRPAGTSK